MLEKLINGLHKFQTEVFPIQKDFFQELTKGQNPDILFVSCSDSRINPHLVTSADPGDLFILRNAGNIIPTYSTQGGEAATIEFAVYELKVKHIIVCGHSHCGAINAVFNIDALTNQPSFASWIDTHISPTLNLVRSNYPGIENSSLTSILLQEHVLQQIENLKTHPAVTYATARHELTLHAWVYEFEHGDISAYNLQNGQFEQIKHF
ncbi:MAG: carbonic anhydrase [Candidatus Babeliales bacterium]